MADKGTRKTYKKVQIPSDDVAWVEEAAARSGQPLTSFLGRVVREGRYTWVAPEFYTRLLRLYGRVEQMDAAILRELNGRRALSEEQLQDFLAAHDQIADFLSLVARGEGEALRTATVADAEAGRPFMEDLADVEAEP